MRTSAEAQSGQPPGDWLWLLVVSVLTVSTLCVVIVCCLRAFRGDRRWLAVAGISLVAPLAVLSIVLVPIHVELGDAGRVQCLYDSVDGPWVSGSLDEVAQQCRTAAQWRFWGATLLWTGYVVVVLSSPWVFRRLSKVQYRTGAR